APGVGGVHALRARVAAAHASGARRPGLRPAPAPVALMPFALLLLALAQAPASDPPLPDARPVVAVRVEAAPQEAARLQRYLQLPLGVPVQADQVRHAVELIYATGAYADVRVEEHPQGQGVEIVFRPQPAPLLVGLRSEGPALFSERALRRASRLRDREALWPQRLQRAAEEVRQ